MDTERPNPNLRTAGETGGKTSLGRGLLSAPAVNAVAELVADLLAATNLLPEDKLNVLRGRAGQGSIAKAILDEGYASSEGVARILAARHHLPLVDLPFVGVDKRASELVPLHVLERLVAIPYALDGESLRVAIADPADLHAIDELRLASRHQLQLSVAAREDILTELRRLSRASEAFGARAALAEEEALLEEEEDVDDLEVDDGISEAPLVRLVNSIIFQAAEDGASDVHFEPQEDALAVRLRIDGVLHEVQRIPKRMMAGVTTRLKVLAKLDIAERRKPQDGRISLNAAAAGRMLDIRVATLPTVEGESVVMRLLDKSKRPPTLEELGLSDEMRRTLEEVVARPTGALLVTGPTGSGKSTTLATMIDSINESQPLHIVTIEDPIEFLHQHKTSVVNQREVGADAKGFAEALRGALRQDPDVILVGEMRDLETISTALTAAETGHLVLATLHTQSAPSTIDRVIDVFPSAQQGQVRMQLAASLQGIVTQTLLPTSDGRRRVPALEVLLPDDAVRNLVRQGKTEQIYSIMQTNTGRGMQTMEQSLAELVLSRQITRETAFGVTSRREEFEALLARSGIAPPSDEHLPEALRGLRVAGAAQ